MKIATYNIWNSEAGMPFRFWQIINEIKNIQADIICLQEVADQKQHNSLAAVCGYAYSHYQIQTGLSILSRLPIYKTNDFDFGTMAGIKSETKTILIINVHLPWDSAYSREKAIVNIVKKAEFEKDDFTLLLGDFNSSADSSVHRFLTNNQSLLESDAYFYDLAEAFSEITETSPPATLNFRKNPRWGVIQPANTIEINQRFDWIMLKNPYPLEFPVLKECRLFGTEISEKNKLSASDHYGVWAEINF